MDDQPQDFAHLMERVRNRSEGAARELIESYGKLILFVVRQHLNSELRSKFDSIDFVQAVWASFFAIATERLDFEGPENLGKFLAAVARNKVTEMVRQRLSTLKYNIRREASMSGTELSSFQGREPTPEEIAIAREEWQRLLGNKPLHQQQILISLREGLSTREIAEQLGFHEKSVRRVVRRIQRENRHE